MSFRSAVKRLGRKTAKLHTQVNRVVVPVVSAAGSYFGGPVVGAAVTAVGSTASGYFRATQARNEGVTGREARRFGRSERNRVAIYGGAAAGAGAVASGITSLAAGGSFWGGAAAGQGGQALLGGTNILSPAQLSASQVAQNAPSLVNVPGVGKFLMPLSQSTALAQSTGGTVGWVGGLAPTAATVAAGGASTAAVTNAIQEALKIIPNQNRQRNGGGLNRDGNGGGSGGGSSDGQGGGGRVGDVNGDGKSGSILPLVLIGAVVLMAA